MKARTLFLTLPLFLFAALACTIEQAVNYEQAKPAEVIDADSALKNFSIALSKAVCSEQCVREFLKREALKQIDNDYDVFYPYVKGLAVDSERSFADVIEQYLEDDISEVEAAVPTLTILVPDLTWIAPDGFCAENWDTSDRRAAVTYKREGTSDKELFVNGYSLGEIEEGCIPGGTVLVVKANERLVADAPTKGGEVTFHFIDDVFDASKNEPQTKDVRYSGRYSKDWIAGQTAEDCSDKMTAAALNAINPDIITAYNLFKDNRYACQNDYIYYGMTGDETKGRLKKDVMPTLVRFKISPKSFGVLFDDSADPDEMKFSDILDTDDNGGKRTEPTLEEIYNALWADGALEIVLEIYGGDSNGAASSLNKKIFDVKAKELFTIKENSISRERWGSTMVKWYVTWQYKLSKRDETTLAEKWYYPENPITLPTWDLLSNSSYYVWAYEIDSQATVNKTITMTTKHSKQNNGKIELSGSFNNYVTLKTETGWSDSDEISSSQSYTVSWKEDNDDMGSIYVRYADKCITGASGTDSYTVWSYSSGTRFTCTILPCVY